MIKMFLVVIFTVNCYAKLSKHDSLLALINQEETILQSVKRQSPRLMYRRFELMSEKLKIYKQLENEVFLQNKNLKREKVFIRTIKKYRTTRAYGLSIIKKHPHNRYRSQILYTLAINSRDYAYDKRSSRYLLKSIRESIKGSTIWYQANVALAEFYYNKKKYKKAIRIYESTISNESDTWHTKNLFNYSWCLFKVHKFSKAINLIEKAYLLSLNPKYIDLSEQIKGSIVIFYVLGKEIQRGITFIQKNIPNKFDTYLSFLKQTSSKGFFEESVQLVNIIDSLSERDPLKLIDKDLFLFDHYKQYKKDTELLKTVKRITTYNLQEYQKEEAVIKFKELVKSYQILLKSSYSKDSPARVEEILKKTLLTFSSLIIIDKDKTKEYLFYMGESLTSIDKFQDAIPYYKRILQEYKKTEKVFLDKVIKSLYYSISKANFSKDVFKKNLMFSYLKNIEIWPEEKDTAVIYQKLFKIHLSNGSNEKMIKTLKIYSKNIPKDVTEQKQLLKINIDYNIQKKDFKSLADRISNIKKGQLSFSNKEINNLDLILTNLLFSKYEKEKNLDIVEKGISKIFFTKNYPLISRQKAALKLAIFYVDTKQPAQTLKWIKRAYKLELLTKESYKDDFRTIAKKMALKQDFTQAANISKFLLSKYCKDQNKDVLKEAILFDLTNNYLRKALYTFDKFRHCTNEIKPIQEKILVFLARKKIVSDYIRFIKKQKLHSIFPEIISSDLESFFWNKNNYKVHKELISNLKLIPESNIGNYLSSFLKWKKEKQQLLTEVLVEESEKEVNLEKFNKNLQGFISKHIELVQKGELLIKSMNAQLIVHSYMHLSLLIDSLSNQIASTKKLKVSRDIASSFQSQMYGLSKQFETKGFEYKRLMNELVEKHFTLPIDNRKVGKGYYTYDL